MNLADSLKHVLKNKSSKIISDFWKRDLKIILKGFSKDITDFYKSGTSSFQHFKNEGINLSSREISESLVDALVILRFLPGRIKDAFTYFKDDLIQELDNQTDSKHKTMFSLKVLGALSSFIMGIFFSVKRGKTEFNLSGLKTRNAFTRFIVAELIFKISQYFIEKILIEVEKELSEPEDKKKIRYFRDLISERSELDHETEERIESDRAVEIVEDLKNFIMTGKRRDIQAKT